MLMLQVRLMAGWVLCITPSLGFLAIAVKWKPALLSITEKKKKKQNREIGQPLPISKQALGRGERRAMQST